MGVLPFIGFSEGPFLSLSLLLLLLLLLLSSLLWLRMLVVAKLALWLHWHWQVVLVRLHLDSADNKAGRNDDDNIFAKRTVFSQ